ncbi:hypothetical protein QL285_009870 [Trifolium repens]|nr:hypothetical protein QL285_009870 [Trifolium repens]
MVSKLLANRLKGCLEKCVSEEQSAFVEGRSINYNAFIAVEFLHALKRKTRGMNGELALKIDISKAYDRVDWGFMCGILERFRFDSKWIHWMMLCVSSVNYSVLVNYEKVGPIHPGRGLRQGDPLSPYLFILVTEGLSSLIKHSVENGDLHGVKICRGAPLVSHLLFVDDCFLFCRANLDETNHLMQILKMYEQASGQEINMTKSEVFFSRNLNIASQEDLSRIMGVRHVLGTGNYLGLPSMIGRKKRDMFAYVKDRIWRRINSWRGRAMSKADKEVMIKSVLQAIPSYLMSVYLLPDTTIKVVERMMNSFWWGGGVNNKGIKWLAWDRMAYPKALGGMGFRDLHSFNMAMIAKQGWNIMTKPNTLVAKLYKARWSIGKGNDIKVMNDAWLRGKEGAWIQSPQVQGAFSIKVNDLMLLNEKRWDRAKIESLFPVDIVNRILDVPLLDMLEEDKLIWEDSTNGHYSLKSGYNLMLTMTWRLADDLGRQVTPSCCDIGHRAVMQRFSSDLLLLISWRASSCHRSTMAHIVLRWNAVFLHFLGFLLSFCILDSVLMLFPAFATQAEEKGIQVNVQMDDLSQLNSGTNLLEEILDNVLSGKLRSIGYNYSSLNQYQQDPETKFTSAEDVFDPCTGKKMLKHPTQHSKAYPVPKFALDPTPHMHNRPKSQRRYRRWVCHHCGKKGHIRPFCFKLYGYPEPYQQAKPAPEVINVKKEWKPKDGSSILITKATPITTVPVITAKEHLYLPLVKPKSDETLGQPSLNVGIECANMSPTKVVDTVIGSLKETLHKSNVVSDVSASVALPWQTSDLLLLF